LDLGEYGKKIVRRWHSPNVVDERNLGGRGVKTNEERKKKVNRGRKKKAVAASSQGGSPKEIPAEKKNLEVQRNNKGEVSQLQRRRKAFGKREKIDGRKRTETEGE